jgi:protein-disulfide isomerase
MKKNITIAIIILVVLGFGYFLFKISPQPNGQKDEFDLSKVQAVSEPRPVEASDHVQGERSAKNTFIVYEDFQCPACAYAHQNITSKVVAEFKDTKLVFRHFPLLGLHQNAVVAAYASEAAAAQGKFWEMADILYGRQGEWSNLTDPLPKFLEFVQAIKVGNLDQFESDSADKKYKDKIEKDLLEALGLGIQGTPTYYFNGQRLENGDLTSLKQQAEKFYKQ